MKPAYRIETERLVVRCWNPSDAASLDHAIRTSVDHLRPWMPWSVDEPVTMQQRQQRMRGWRAAFDLDDDYVYGIFDAGEETVIGGTGLHTRLGSGVLEIGYWIGVDHAGRGYATEVSAALTKVAFEVHEIARVEIHHDPNNVASGRIPEKLGFQRDATLRRRARTPQGEWRDTVVWTLMDDEYPSTPAAQAMIKSFDCAGSLL